MKKLIYLFAALSLLCTASFNLFAQETYTDWHDIDKITVKEKICISAYQTIYLVPVEEDASVVKFSDDREKVVNQVFKQVAAFRSLIQKKIKGSFRKLDVRIVDEVPDSLAKDELLIKIKYTEFDLGSAALRGWVGGGNASVSIDATISTADCPDAISFSQCHKSGLMSPNAYDKILKEQQEKFAKDFVLIFKELEKLSNN